jgi:hypothetical protein
MCPRHVRFRWKSGSRTSEPSGQLLTHSGPRPKKRADVRGCSSSLTVVQPRRGLAIAHRPNLYGLDGRSETQILVALPAAARAAVIAPWAGQPGGASLVTALRKVYSITSSAVASSEFGTVIPSVFAVLRLMTSSNLVGCTTGKSAGLSPLRILPA